MPTDEAHGPQERPSAQVGALAAALLLLVTVLVFFHGCGSEDLVFPGNIPATFTPAPSTVTETPDEDEEL
jgi:hypothetical protein